MQKNEKSESEESTCSSWSKQHGGQSYGGPGGSENTGRQREVFPRDSELRDMAGNFLVL